MRKIIEKVISIIISIIFYFGTSILFDLLIVPFFIFLFEEKTAFLLVYITSFFKNWFLIFVYDKKGKKVLKIEIIRVKAEKFLLFLKEKTKIEYRNNFLYTIFYLKIILFLLIFLIEIITETVLFFLLIVPFGTSATTIFFREVEKDGIRSVLIIMLIANLINTVLIFMGESYILEKIF